MADHNYEEAAAHVHRYLTFDKTLLQSTLVRESGACIIIAVMVYFQSMPEPETGGRSWVDIMDDAHRNLQETIQQRLQLAMVAQDHDAVERLGLQTMQQAIDTHTDPNEGLPSCIHCCCNTMLGSSCTASTSASRCANIDLNCTYYHILHQITLKIDDLLTEAKESVW